MQDEDGYDLCRCCGESVLPFVGGSYPEHELCDSCGRGKCSDCITEVRKLWGSAQSPNL